MAELTVFADPANDDHVVSQYHPERRARLDAALLALDAAGLREAAEVVAPREASAAELARVHDAQYVAAVEAFCAAGGGALDADTTASRGSWATARRAAGAVLDAVDALRAGTTQVAFTANRPPGHHAEHDRAMGFCLFNNVAVGAAELAAAGERVAIVDWDVHHGNGTQHMFYDRPDVFYVSTHQAPLYPGTGYLLERGAGDGEGTNLNVPFPPGTGGDAFRAAFDDVIVPELERFAPDWLLISAGFDAHRADPLADLELTAADYADLTQRLMTLVPQGRVVVVLEGGYDLDAITMGAGATLSTLLGGSYRPEPASVGDTGMGAVALARQAVAGGVR
ncbi:MAG TPA: histone deacetylase [Ilumatobacter sp.]|nr:histone deacetylase [Ilumatobacter sp.]